MQGFPQRHSQWHNGKTKRKGHLWEDRFKSVIVEDGVAADAALWKGDLALEYRKFLLAGAGERAEARV